jgi:lysophospholipase L1-like esterase
VLSFGVNDTTIENHALRSAPGSSVSALREIQSAVDPIRTPFVGPPAVSDQQHNSRICHIDAALKEECLRLGIPFVDTFHATLANPDWQQQVNAGDGYHPDAEGYTVLASIVTEPILGWLT